MIVRHHVVLHQVCGNACMCESCICESRSSYGQMEEVGTTALGRSRTPLTLIRFVRTRRSRMSCLCRSRQSRAAPQTEVDLRQEVIQTV